MARASESLSEDGMFSHHAALSTQHNPCGDRGRLPADRQKPASCAAERRIRPPPDPPACWRSSPRPGDPNSRPAGISAAACVELAIGSADRLPPARGRPRSRQCAGAPGQCSTARKSPVRTAPSRIPECCVMLIPRFCILSKCCRSFTRALAMCERTVAFEQFKRAATSSAGRSSTSRSSSAVRSRLGQHIQARLPDTRGAPCAAPSAPDFPSRETDHRLGHVVEVGKTHAARAAQKIDGGVAGDARQPVRGLVQILQLILPLQRLDERFLGQILGVGDVAHDAVDQQEHAAHVLGHKPALRSDESGTRRSG